MSEYIKKLFLASALISLSSCTNAIFSPDSLFAPKPYKMGEPAKNAPPAYKQGWKDGCQTGLSTMVPTSYKSFYKYTIDPDMIAMKNEEGVMYQKAWKDSYTYCRHYSFRYVWDAFDKGGSGWGGPLCVLCPDEADRS